MSGFITGENGRRGARIARGMLREAERYEGTGSDGGVCGVALCFFFFLAAVSLSVVPERHTQFLRFGGGGGKGLLVRFPAGQAAGGWTIQDARTQRRRKGEACASGGSRERASATRGAGGAESVAGF